MATKTSIYCTDDLDGTEDAASIEFSLGVYRYSIDLADPNMGRLEEALAPFVAAARPVRSGKNVKAGRSYDPKAVRAWAQSNGYDVGDRGRVSADIIAAYQAAS